MKECLDEGRLQSFFDGELPADMLEETARHIASCAACTAAVRELESEHAIFLGALEPEMSVSVPTEQLRMRIVAAVAQMNSPARPLVRESVVGRGPWWLSLGELFRFTPQRAMAFASILTVIVLGLIFAAVKLKRGQEASPPSGTPMVKVTPLAGRAIVPTPVPNSSPTDVPPKTALRPGARQKRARPAGRFTSEDRVAGIKLIPGEQSYLKTIATLNVSLKGDQRSMSPNTRAEYERNLKLVDYAIAATRSKAKRTPHDPDAAGFMFAAYQSKIDLLSTMNEQARLTQH